MVLSPWHACARAHQLTHTHAGRVPAAQPETASLVQSGDSSGEGRHGNSGQGVTTQPSSDTLCGSLIPLPAHASGVGPCPPPESLPHRPTGPSSPHEHPGWPPRRPRGRATPGWDQRPLSSGRPFWKVPAGVHTPEPPRGSHCCHSGLSAGWEVDGNRLDTPYARGPSTRGSAPHQHGVSQGHKTRAGLESRSPPFILKRSPGFGLQPCPPPDLLGISHPCRPLPG